MSLENKVTELSRLAYMFLENWYDTNLDLCELSNTDNMFSEQTYNAFQDKIQEYVNLIIKEVKDLEEGKENA